MHSLLDNIYGTLHAIIPTAQINFEAVKYIHPIPYLIFVGILVIFLFYSFKQWYLYVFQLNVIENIPTAKIRSAAQGYVELSGTQHNLENINNIAPMSQLPCTWYRYRIEKYVQKKWTLIEQGESYNPFILKDDTGTCIVDPKGATINTTIFECWQGFRPHPNGKPSNLFWRILGTLGYYQYKEWRMMEGTFLYAIGNFRTVNEDPLKPSVNILSNQGLTSDRPFILHTITEKKIALAFRLEAIKWFFSYIILTVLIGLLMVIRF